MRIGTRAPCVDRGPVLLLFMGPLNLLVPLVPDKGQDSTGQRTGQDRYRRGQWTVDRQWTDSGQDRTTVQERTVDCGQDRT